VNWELTDLTGSRDTGGYTGHIRIHEAVPPTLIRDGSLIVIFAEDWYGDKLNKQSIGGNALNRSSTVFVGYVLQGSTKYNYRDSTVEFQFGSPSEMMKLAEGFAVSVQYSNDPATATNDPNIPSGWVALLGMDTRRALYHYLRWHSTVLLTNDFQFLGTDQYLQYFDADRTSVYDAIQSVMKSALVGKVVCDRQGKIWAERDIYVEQSAYPTTFTLTNRDWMGDARIEERRTPQTSFIEMGGIYFNGTDYFPYLTNAPGVVPGYRGRVERIQGLALASQNDLNVLAGNVFAQRNITYPNLELDLAGNYRNFDIAPQEKLPVTLALTDSIRGITFTDKNFYINRMSWQYNPQIESFLPALSAIEIGSGFAGDTVIIPEIPPEEGFGEPTIPQIVIPPFNLDGLQINGGNNSVWFRPIVGNIAAGVPFYADASNNGDLAPDSVAQAWSFFVSLGAAPYVAGRGSLRIVYKTSGAGTISPNIAIFRLSTGGLSGGGIVATHAVTNTGASLGITPLNYFSYPSDAVGILLRGQVSVAPTALRIYIVGILVTFDVDG
jgi:hypothetical protein